MSSKRKIYIERFNSHSSTRILYY